MSTPKETRRAFARSIQIWIRQDGVGLDFITERLAEYDAVKPCPNVISSGECTHYCALAESSVKELREKIDALLEAGDNMSAWVTTGDYGQMTVEEWKSAKHGVHAPRKNHP